MRRQIVLGLVLAGLALGQVNVMAAPVSVQKLFVDENQHVVIGLSGAHGASLSSTTYQGQRLIVVDIAEATLAAIPNKTALLKSIVSQIPQVEKASLDPFGSNPPIVRLVMTMKNTHTYGTIVQNDSDSIIIAFQDLQQTATRPSAGSERPTVMGKTGPGKRENVMSTLADISPASVNQLEAAEKAYREGKQDESNMQLDLAETAYLSAIKLAPQVQDYSVALSELYLKQGNADKAQNILEAAMPYHPQDINLLNERGKVALYQHNNEAAVEYFKQAIPAGVLSNYAVALRRTGHPDQAEALYKLAIESQPNDADLNFNLGNLYLSEKRYAEAENLFHEAIHFNPDFAQAHYHLGLVLAQQGQYTNAVHALSKYLMLAPNADNHAEVERYISVLRKKK